jgi:hypothetical protein
MPPYAGSRDGSRFTFDHVSGIIHLWVGSNSSTGKGASRVRQRFIATLA